MQDEKKIQALLAANTPENQKIAIQLIQSQWGFDKEKTYSYIVDFYCNANDKEFSLYLENKTINYAIVHHQEPQEQSYIYLTFTMVQDNVVKQEEPFMMTYEDNRILKDYIGDIKTHFGQLLPTILQD